MSTLAVLVLTAAFFGLGAASQARAERDYLKSVPKDGEIPYGKIVYVDDGKCPRGEIKEITGGSRSQSIPRKTRCVKRPSESK